MEKLGSSWNAFNEILHMNMFWKSAPKNRVSLKSDEYSEYFTFLYLAQFLLESEMFNIQYAQKTETHVLCSNLSFSKIVPFIRCKKKMAQPDKTRMTRGRLRITCWITKPTNTHSEHVWLLLLYINSCEGNASQPYVHKCSACLVIFTEA
jgi:hypothetical protein